MKLVLILFLFIGCAQIHTKRSDNKVSILQGLTSAKEVEFSVVALKNRNLRFELRNEAGKTIAPEELKIIIRDHSDFAVFKMVFAFEQALDHNIYVFEGEKLLDQRLIGKGSLNSSRLKLAVASCLNDYETEHFNIWDTLLKKDPEYLLLIGDNVYSDRTAKEVITTDPEILWNRYVDMRLKLPLFYQQKLIATHALWDDHDFGINDGGSEYKHRRASKEIFEAFWAQNLGNESWTKGFGVGGLLTLGDFNLYFLDGRSFRTLHPEGSHIGIDQEAWLLKNLIDETNPSILIKGDQFFGGYHSFESFEGRHPQDFSKFIASLKKLPTPFIFMSGDRHFSEIMQFPRSMFGRPSFELTSSPLHAFHPIKQEDFNPWRVVSVKNKNNFLMIDNEAIENHWFMEVESIGSNGEVLFRRELALFIKDLQDNLQEVRKRRHGRRRYYRRSKKRR